MKRAEPMRIDAVIRQMIDSTGLRPEFNRRSIESVWPDVVGRNIASYTGRIFVKDRTLNVQIVSAPLREELSYIRESLVQHLNEAVGAEVITAIRFL